jgi:hypothetical protein
VAPPLQESPKSDGHCLPLADLWTEGAEVGEEACLLGGQLLSCPLQPSGEVAHRRGFEGQGGLEKAAAYVSIHL